MIPSTREKKLRRFLQQEKLTELLLVAAVALVITSDRLLTADPMFYGDSNWEEGYDHKVYLLMSQTGISCHVPPMGPEAPFCWRLLTPLLAKTLPFDIQTNFLVLAFAGVWLTGVAVYYMAKAFGFSKALAALGMLLFFSMFWANNYLLHNFWLNEPLLFLTITLAITAAVRQRPLRFALLVAVGVALKESALFVVPLFYTLNAKKPFDARLAKRTMALALPALAVFFAIRTSLPVPAPYFQLLKELGLSRLTQPSFEMLYMWTVGTFGLVPTLASLLAIRRNIVPFLRFSPFLLLVYSQPLFASDTHRLLVLAFPAVIILALNGFAWVRDGTVALWTRVDQSSPRTSS